MYSVLVSKFDKLYDALFQGMLEKYGRNGGFLPGLHLKSWKSPEGNVDGY